MHVAFGLKAHSGWAALVVLGEDFGALHVVDRRRIDLVDEEWAKQPYHAAEFLKPAEARDVVERGVESAHRIAIREIKEAVRRERERKNAVAACAVLVGNPMPDWSVDEILSVHFRMHKAEGVLFKDALVRGAKKSRLRVVAVPEKQLPEHAARALGTTSSRLTKEIAELGKTVGPPWGKDQKDAALAALIALRRRAG